MLLITFRFIWIKDPRGNVTQDASIFVCPPAREAVARPEHRTTILPCSASWSVTKPLSPLHLLPLQRALSAVRDPVILTVIQDAVSKPASQHFLNIPLTRMIWDMLDIPRVTLALLRDALLLVPLSANQVSCIFK